MKYKPWSLYMNVVSTVLVYNVHAPCSYFLADSKLFYPLSLINPPWDIHIAVNPVQLLRNHE